MRVVHFSDIHATRWLSGWHGYFDKRLLGAINYLLRRRNQQHWDWVSIAVEKIKELTPEVVVCSGDITSLSSPAEFNKSISALKPLWQDPKIIFIYVPGNHDHYVQDRDCFNALENAFYCLNQNRWQLSDLPLIFNQNGVQFILVNEALPVSWLMSTGMITKQTNQWLFDFLFTPECDNSKLPMRVLIGHFPLYDHMGQALPRRRCCQNMNTLIDAFKNEKINISLCGHIHHHYIRVDNRNSIEICAGSLTTNGVINYLEFSDTHKSFNQRWINVIEV